MLKLNMRVVSFVVWLVLSIAFIFHWAMLAGRTYCALEIITHVFCLTIFAVFFAVSYFVVPPMPNSSVMFRYLVMLLTSVCLACGVTISINYSFGDLPKEEVAEVSYPRIELDDSRSFEYNKPVVDLIYENKELGVKTTSANNFYMKVRGGDTVSMLVKRGVFGFYVLMDEEPVNIKYRKNK